VTQSAGIFPRARLVAGRAPLRAGSLVALALVLSFALPAAAQAKLKTYTLQNGPIRMGNFNVKFPKVPTRAPGVDGYVVGMTTSLVDRRGRAITIRDVMLHHIVFHRVGRSGGRWPCSGASGEAIYGTGEEKQNLRLPTGYGYRVRKGDKWRLTAMLMSHSEEPRNVYIRYRVTVMTGKQLKIVRPFWVRASGCGAQVSYPVEGGGEPGSTDTRAYNWKVPFNGRIVAVGGHLHGGARDMWLSQPRCGDRRLLDTSPRFGMPDNLYYRAKPILHEPGPVDTRYFLSRQGIPVRKGETIRLTGAYEKTRPHPRVMAIMHVYLSPDNTVPTGCRPLPADRRELTKYKRVRTEPPAVNVPLNTLGADGHTHTVTTPLTGAKPLADGATVALRNARFTPGHVSVEAGSSLTWRFQDAIPHNVLLASGPRLVGSPTLSRGTATSRFAVPGRYELFCYLHPITMHEVVDVRPRNGLAPPAAASASSSAPAGADPGASGGDEAW
jgi:plastocyanin